MMQKFLKYRVNLSVNSVMHSLIYACKHAMNREVYPRLLCYI